MIKLNLFGKIVIYTILTFFAALFCLPLLWMVSTALKPLDQTMTNPPQWLPYQYSVCVDNKIIPIEIENKISEDSVLIRTEGSNNEVLVSSKKVKNGFLINNSEDIQSQKIPITVIKHIPASIENMWTKVKSENKDDNSKLKNKYFPISKISRKIDFKWGNFYHSIKAMKFFPAYLTNTLILCFLTCLGTVFSSAFVAYGFAKIDWKGKNIVFIIVLSTMMIPFVVTMVPLYDLFRSLGMIGTLQPLWITAFFGGAFNIFLLRQFFMTIPKELSEAAIIDGCSDFQIFSKIILPISKPALLVVVLFQFMYTWNDFLGPLIYLTDQKDYTIALGLQFFQSQHGGTSWNYLMAASTIMVIPVIILFFFTQKSFIEGISTTGFKG